MKTTTKHEAQTTTATSDDAPTTIAGLESLGFGYDITDKYANNASLKLPIINLEGATKMVEAHGRSYRAPESIEVKVLPLNENLYEFTTGTSLEYYRENLNVNTQLDGRYYFFSGSLNVDFSMDSMQNFENEFSTVRNVIKLYTLNLPDPDTLTMIPTAAADINGETGMSGLDVLNKYGSHYVWECVMGGRADYSSSTDSLTFNQSYDLAVSAKLSYEQAVGKISVENQSKYGKEIQSFDSSSETKVHTQGGNASLGGVRILDHSGQGYDNWVDTVQDNPVLMDFTKESLIPIWTLCDTKERAAELEGAFQAYMEASSQPIEQTKPILDVQFTDQLILAGTDHDSGAQKDLMVYRPVCSEGYYWVGQYAQGDHNQPNGWVAIVKSLTPGSLAKPVDYYRVWDNEGGKGKYKYSCWRPVPPTGYVALGYVMRLWVKNQDKPSGEEVEGLMCVHESLVVEAQANNTDIWNDHGTRANEDCSIYAIIPNPKDVGEDGNTTGINAGTYYGQRYNNSHAPNPTSPRVYCLDRSKVNIKNAEDEPKA